MWRNDGANTYLLFTNSGDQNGSWNSLRPFYVNDSSGAVNIGTTLSASGYIYSGNYIQSAGSVYATGYFHTSDVRLKEKIAASSGLSIVERLRGVTFDWKKDGTPSAGVIAQEVKSILPSAVHTDAQGVESVDYDQIIAPLIESIKEQQQEIDAQNAKINQLTHDIQQMASNHQ